VRIVRLFLALMLVACGGAAGAANAPTAAPSPNAVDSFPEPPLVASSGGVVHVALAAAVNPATGAPAFVYQGQYVAPTIEVQPGDTIQIDYTNQLPQSTNPPNMTNLHFHGLTVSPNAPADEVLETMAMPGQTLHYSVPIPADTQPGLYWYHPHSHGESNWQVENGMAGAIIVDGIEVHDPAVATMRTRVVLLEDPQDQPSYANLLEGRRALAQARVTRAESGYDACRGEEGRHVTINGLSSAQIGIRPGEQEFFRVVNASADRYFDLAVDGEALQLVAADGYPLDSYPGNAAVQSVDHILIPPSGRAEFIVTGQHAPTVLRSNCVDTGPDGDPGPAVVLASLVNDGATTSTTAMRVRPFGKPLQLNPFMVGPIPAPVAQRTITLTENVVTNAFFINGAAFNVNDAPQIVSQSGTTEEWTVVNETGEVHAFHLHQVHFAVEAINGAPQSSEHWVDTVNVPYETPGNGAQQPGTVKLLVDFRDPVIRGTFVYHCHILEHEDGGMMAKIQVE
jgi:suppressor of ftsI